MIRVPIGQLQPGQRLARSIYSLDGHVLLRAGTELKPAYIQRLAELGLPAVYILEPADDPAETDRSDILSFPQRQQALHELRKAFDAAYKGHPLDLHAIDQTVHGIVEAVLSDDHCMTGMAEIRSIDDYTYHHSVSVCLLSILVGVRLNLDRQQLHELGIGALLHDIGKVFISPEILRKRGPLSPDEFAEIRKHPKFGFDYLRRVYGVNLISAHIAYQHHERLDGSGYPRGLVGDELHPLSRIVCVVDVYDAMTADRGYRPAHDPDSVFEYLRSRQDILFDREVIAALRASIAPYPIGERVLLNTGEVGIVTRLNPRQAHTPTLRIVARLADNGTELPVSPHVEVQLDTDPNRRIVRRLGYTHRGS